MADTSVAITPGSGANIDSRTEGTNGNHRQVVVLGDPATNAGVAPVDATNGLAVDVKTLPPGAATEAKQAAPGIAGTPSSDTVTIQGVTGMVAVKVDGSTVTQPVSGTVTANAGSGTMAVSASSLPLPTGAATAAKQPALGAAGSASADVISVQGIASMIPFSVGGGVAHDGADSGFPNKIGAKAKSALSGVTLVSADDRTDLFADLDGVQIVRLNAAIGDYTGGSAAITDGSSTSVISAAGAGIKIYVTDIIIANSSATNVTVDLRDGTAGSVRATFPVPANGGVVHRLGTPAGFSANTAVAADPSAAASTITVTLAGFKSKI